MVRRLLLLNGIAILLVPIHHATGLGFEAMFMYTDRYLPVTVPNYDQIGSLAFYAFILIQQLDYFALPAFMFVSGFFASFAASGPEAELKWKVIRARVWHLLVPLAVWTAIFFLLFVRGLPNDLDQILDRYYFVPLLMQFYLLARFLMPLAKKYPRLVLIGAAALELGRFTIFHLNRLDIHFAGQSVMMQVLPRWLFPTLFFWFALGAVGGYHRQTLGQLASRYKWQLLAATLALAALSLAEYALYARYTNSDWLGPYFGGYARQVYALTFILTFLAFDQVRIPFAPQLSELGTRSLGIYLAHNRVMFVVAVLLYERLPWVLGNQFLYQAILITTALVGSLVLMELVKRSPARPAYRYIFG